MGGICTNFVPSFLTEANIAPLLPPTPSPQTTVTFQQIEITPPPPSPPTTASDHDSTDETGASTLMIVVVIIAAITMLIVCVALYFIRRSSNQRVLPHPAVIPPNSVAAAERADADDDGAIVDRSQYDIAPLKPSSTASLSDLNAPSSIGGETFVISSGALTPTSTSGGFSRPSEISDVPATVNYATIGADVSDLPGLTDGDDNVYSPPPMTIMYDK